MQLHESAASHRPLLFVGVFEHEATSLACFHGIVLSPVKLILKAAIEYRIL